LRELERALRGITSNVASQVENVRVGVQEVFSNRLCEEKAVERECAKKIGFLFFLKGMLI